MSRIVLKKSKEGDEDEILLTSDGALVLESMRMEHPVGKLLASLAKAQKDECGDGATTAVVLACSLLENAEELLKIGLHPSMIIEGYKLAGEKVVEILEQKPPTIIDAHDDAVLRDVVRSLMNSRVINSSPEVMELFSNFVIRLLRAVLGKSDLKALTASDISLRLDNIKIIKKTGESLADSELMLDGFLIEDREVVHPNMPVKVENASIALVKSLEVKKLPAKSGVSPLETMKLEATSPEDYNQFMKNRDKFAVSMAEKIGEAGANAALVNMGIDELVEHYLMRRKVLAVKRVNSEDMDLIAKLTYGTVVGNVDDLSQDKLGKAGSVEEIMFGDLDHCIKIGGCKGARAASVVLRGSSRQVLDEAERSLKVALIVTGKLMSDPRVVPGGGATEMELAHSLRSYALTFSGKEQFAIKQYARSLEVVPWILAENSGLDALDTIINLRKAHRNGLASWGVEALDKTCADMKEERIFDPLRAKLNALKGASELAIAILRISGIEKVIRHSEGGKADRMEGEESSDEGIVRTPGECRSTKNQV
jgi:chaperonin GroEL (HSP60 family)